ncbi:hypothetical protein EV194_11317 [Natronoflexus pectinivorans]|uniref:Uncharacterized protein n=1 Tax=Natronoflexus pectinivorans TaxID=682526 RepID=A0A4R2GED3_9BACT|nr:hypothetical protein EV194_11317 [Natronoflexus pectinivorans]
MKRAMRKLFSHRRSTEPSRSKNDWIGEFSRVLGILKIQIIDT